MQNDDRRLGLIGLGLIGTALARRLIAAGFSVDGYDPAAEARERLVGSGGTPVGSIAEIAKTCRRVLVAVFDTAQVEAVTEGSDGLLAVPEGERATRQVLSFSTCDPDRIAALAARLQARGLDLLETPLSGASDQVARGEAVCLVGGERATLEACRDILDVVCAKSFFMGAAGNGGKAKLATNLVLGLNRAAIAEGLVYAERLGLPLDLFFDELRQSAAYSAVMDVKGPKMIARDYQAFGKVSQSAKDFALILQTAGATGQALPFAETYAAMMADAVAAGQGDLDNSAIVEAVRRQRRAT